MAGKHYAVNGQFLTLRDIVFEKKVEPTEATAALINKLVRYTNLKKP